MLLLQLKKFPPKIFTHNYDTLATSETATEYSTPCSHLRICSCHFPSYLMYFSSRQCFLEGHWKSIIQNFDWYSMILFFLWSTYNKSLKYVEVYYKTRDTQNFKFCWWAKSLCRIKTANLLAVLPIWKCFRYTILNIKSKISSYLSSNYYQQKMKKHLYPM